MFRVKTSTAQLRHNKALFRFEITRTETGHFLLMNSPSNQVAVVLLIIAATILSGCSGTVVTDSARTRVVVDGLGREVSVAPTIRRAVSLAPSVTENVFAVGAGERLVGVTSYCNYPREAAAIDKVGDTLAPNIEKIIALRPDVVIVTTASQLEAFTKTLDDRGIAVFVSNPVKLTDITDDLRRLGDLFGTSEIADHLANELDARAAMMRETNRAKQAVNAFVQISKQPLYSIGKDAFLTEAFEIAGARVLTADIPGAFPVISKESAIAMSPEVIFISDSPDNDAPNEAFDRSPAVLSRRVFRLNADMISRPGPRLFDAIEEISRSLAKA